MKNFLDNLKFTLPAALIGWALFVLLMLMMFKPAHADDTNPSAPTPKLEWAYQSAALADMLTTLDIKNHQGWTHTYTDCRRSAVSDPPCVTYTTTYSGITELNPLLGQRPSDVKVLGYFAVTGALHYLVTRELVRENVPAPIVNTWEALGIALEVGMVAHNYSIGLHARF